MGILNVTGKDKGTGKEQNVVIKSCGGLSDDDVERMVRDAEVHAEADAEKKRAIDTRNELDSLIYSTEKSLKEHGEKLDEETKKDLEEAKAKTEALSQASMKMGSAIYGQQKKEDGAAAEGEDAPSRDGDTVDADFEEKKDDTADGK